MKVIGRHERQKVMRPKCCVTYRVNQELCVDATGKEKGIISSGVTQMTENIVSPTTIINSELYY